MPRRLVVFLACTFSLTACAWGALVNFRVSGVPFFLLYATGGLSPTIAALLAARITGTFTEYRGRLFRFRVGLRWYGVALGVPLVLTLGAAAGLRPVIVAPLYWFVPALAAGILGGGLEELGWRGIAQPDLERSMPRPLAAAIVGALWALWHLPLFAIPTAPQSGWNYPLFALAVMGNAQLLAWLHHRTRSIPLCVLFHAADNAAWFVVIGSLYGRMRAAAVAAAVIRLIAGAVAAFHQGGGASRPVFSPKDAKTH